MSADLHCIFYATKLSLENKLTQIQKLLDNWTCRNLTLFGRIINVKSLAVVKLNSSITDSIYDSTKVYEETELFSIQL